MLGSGEDQRLVDPTGRDEVAEQFALALAVDHVDDLGDELGRGVARRDLDVGRIVQQVPCQSPDLVGERRREEQRLPRGGDQRDDALDVGDEAHVEHAVGLVEDEDPTRAQVDRPPSEVVDSRPGRDDIRGRRAARFGSTDATVDGGRADGVLRTVGPTLSST